MTTVVISPFRTVQFLEGGGHFWVYMQYVESRSWRLDLHIIAKTARQVLLPLSNGAY